MELLDLQPPRFGIARPGIYVLDDEGAGLLAGPFAEVADALAWIGRTQPERRAAAREARPGGQNRTDAGA